MYSKSQRYVDGRLPWCFDCLNVQLHKKRDNKKNVCFAEKKNLLNLIQVIKSIGMV